MRILLYALFSLSCSLSVNGQPWVVPNHDGMVLFFVGDIMQHQPQIQSAWSEEQQDYQYQDCFQYISPYWNKADYVIGNLETTLSDCDFSGYPCFCAPWQLVRDLQASGLDILTTSNNHSCDRGRKGIARTIYYLDSLQMPHTGTFTDTLSWLQQTPLYICHDRFKVALLNYTYGTNGISVPKGQVVSMIDTFHMKRQIEKARLDRATNIIVMLHWGDEYVTKPNSYQSGLAGWLHNHGVDIVVGGHPHVVQPLEYVMSGNDTVGVTVFSLGNFISNQSELNTNGGIAVSLRLEWHKGRIRYSMQYLSNYVWRPFIEGRRRYYVVPEPDVTTVLGRQDSIAYRRFFRNTDAIINNVSLKYQP